MVRKARIPSMVIFWADTRKALSVTERRELEFNVEVVSITPTEIKAIDRVSDRQVIFRGMNDVRSASAAEFPN